MVRSFPIKAGTVIDFIGAEVAWSIFQSGDRKRWYVTASHNGESAEDSFKFTRHSTSLDKAVACIGRDLWRHGPEWIKTWDNSGRKRKVRL